MSDNIEENNGDVNLDTDQFEVRQAKLQKMREIGNAYPNDFKIEEFIKDIADKFGQKNKEELAEIGQVVAVAGRIIAKRLMGKAAFVSVQDMTGKIQLYVKKANLSEDSYNSFLDWDLGDIVGVTGEVFKTNTGELSVKVSELKSLVKALRPLPSQYYGLADTEVCYRQRYIDLMINEDTKERFIKRSKIIQSIRNFLLGHSFLEVETPMMHTLAGGAAAKPFTTHHNALNIPLYLRIAPELYLKRLVVGGIDRVFEINRNFRNEGLSRKHNPEFTMLEFYQAYADFEDAMDLSEALLRNTAKEVLGTTEFTYQGHKIDFAKPFTRISFAEILPKYNPELKPEMLRDRDALAKFAISKGIDVQDSWGAGKLQLEIFEETVEDKLIEPTFVILHPKEVSPLARETDGDPFLTDRVELFIAGAEFMNSFSELNDPHDQAQRFKQQLAEKEAGDEEAMPFDDDYITALEYGLAPTAGCGIGIDRLVMLLTDSASIKDVILFPHMKPVGQDV